jgi:DNA-binding Xre family transcriptional regulator
MSANVGDMTKRGRPVGLLINPDAARYVLGKRPQSWLATVAEISTAHLSAVFSGSKGVTREVADRLCAALDCEPGVIFPELVQFRTEVRIFTAPSVDEVAA